MTNRGGRRFRGVITAGCSLILFVLLIGCPNTFGSQSNAGWVANPGGHLLAFDLSGARALGITESSVNDLRSSDNESLTIGQSSKLDFRLIKILDDGSVEVALESFGNIALPEIKFIAVDPNPENRNLYVAFERELVLGQNVRLSSFLHARPDGTYFEVLPQSNGEVTSENWWGIDSYKPVVFDRSGNMYFVFYDYARNDSILYQYNPNIPVATALTSHMSGVYFENFKIDPSGNYLIVLGNRGYTGVKTQFLKIFNVQDMRNPITVFDYADIHPVWKTDGAGVYFLRDFVISARGDELILNGYGIQGLDGIMRASIESSSKVFYSTLFADITVSFSTVFGSVYDQIQDRTFIDGLFDKFVTNSLGPGGILTVLTNKSTFFYVELKDLFESNENKIFGLDAPEDEFGNQPEKLSINKSELYFAVDLEDPKKFLDIGNVEEFNIETLQQAGAEGFFSSMQFVTREPNYLYDSMYYSSREWTFTPVSRNVVKHFLSSTSAIPDQLYFWNEHWLDQDGKLLSDAVQQKWAGRFFTTEVDFQYGGYHGSTAWNEFKNEEPYTSDKLKSSTISDSWAVDFIEKYDFVVRGSSEPATTIWDFFKNLEETRPDDYLENFLYGVRDIGFMFYADDGSLWGLQGAGLSSNPIFPVRFLDSLGDRALKINPSVGCASVKPIPFAVSHDYIYYREFVGLCEKHSSILELWDKHREQYFQAVESANDGYQILYRVSLHQPGTPENVLLNSDVPDGRLKGLEYSVGDGWLYFTGKSDDQPVVGRINTDSLAYERLPVDFVLNKVEVY